MKQTFTGKIRLIILLVFLITLIQGIVVLNLVGGIQNDDLVMSVQNTVIIAIFLQFLLLVSLFFYIPVFMRKSFSEIHNVLNEIAKGRYNLEIDMEYFKKHTDKEIYSIFLSIQKMLQAVYRFDKLKKAKIVEHHNRINALLKLAQEGIMILDLKGNIVYMNELCAQVFPSLVEKSNLVDSNLPPVLEKNLKKYVITVLDKKSKQDPVQFFIADLKRHVTLDSAIVRDDEGKATGAVISVRNIQIEKKQKKQKDEDKVSEKSSE